RRAVYDGAGEAWRLGAHARAAAALERMGAAPTARAHHVDRSAEPGDEAAVALLIEAGRAAAARAPASAAGWYASALRLLPQSAEPERRLALLVPLAVSLGTSGRP